MTEADLDRAIALWKRDASPRGRDLVDPIVKAAVKTDTDPDAEAPLRI